MALKGPTAAIAGQNQIFKCLDAGRRTPYSDRSGELLNGPLFALQELGGWGSAELVRRYAHLAADHPAPFAERLSALTAPEIKIHGTFTAQPENQAT